MQCDWRGQPAAEWDKGRGMRGCGTTVQLDSAIFRLRLTGKGRGEGGEGQYTLRASLGGNQLDGGEKSLSESNSECWETQAPRSTSWLRYGRVFRLMSSQVVRLAAAQKSPRQAR